MKLDLLGLQINSPLTNPEAKNFRPPSWPPPADWAPILDAQCNPQCIYSDPIWPLDVWAGKPLKLNFGDGKTKGSRIDHANADLLRQCATWFMWGPRGCRTATTLIDRVTIIKKVFVVCSEQGILASDLMRFEAVIDKLAASLAPSVFYKVITILHDLLDAREHLGFCLLNQDGLARLARQAPVHQSQQTPYVPPRIWSYQLSRLRECLEDYAKHQAKVEECFKFCMDAYANNDKELKKAANPSKKLRARTTKYRLSRQAYRDRGPFKMTADRYGITDLIARWVSPFTEKSGEKQIAKLSQYLDLVSAAGLAYIMNFSLMRIEEGYSLRSDCLHVEKDDMFGDIPMLVGETTKTDPDSDARWPVSKSASLAIDAMKHIAFLRMLCARELDNIGLTPQHEANPYLISYQYEPWGRGQSKPYGLRPVISPYQQELANFPLLLDSSQIAIQEEDLKIARLLTPTLDMETFKVGVPWTFGWHQLRRTGAVNMQASGDVDDSSLQLLLKHQSRVMTLYYGRNHSRLALNQETRTLFLKTMYQELVRDLRKLPSPQYVSPLGESRKAAIVSFFKETDAVALDKAASQGKVGARRIRAGFCVNHRSCPYGGIEAIAHCLGGDDGKGCPDLLLDMKKEEHIKAYEKVVDDQLKVVHPESPRHQSLQVEKRAIGKFYAVVKAQNC